MVRIANRVLHLQCGVPFLAMYPTDQQTGFAVFWTWLYVHIVTNWQRMVAQKGHCLDTRITPPTKTLLGFESHPWLRRDTLEPTLWSLWTIYTINLENRVWRD